VSTSGAVWFMVVGGGMATTGICLAADFRQAATRFTNLITEIREAGGPSGLPGANVTLIRFVGGGIGIMGLGAAVLGAVHL